MFSMLLFPLLLMPKIQVCTEAETEQMRAEIEALVQANRVKRCPRPGLWDEAPTLGDAGASILKIIKGSENAACLQAAEGLKSKPKPEEVAAQVEAEAKVKQACVALPKLIHKAVSHAEGCSPYLTGRNQFSEMMRVLSISKVVVVLAQAEVEAGRVEAAATLLLETIRFNQDLMRGGTSPILGMLAVATDGMLLHSLEPLLPQLKAERIKAALDCLIAHDPHFSEFLQADGVQIFYYDILPGIDQGKPTGLTFGAEIPDDATLAWIAMREIAADYAKACDVRRSLKECAVGLKALDEALAEVKPVGWKSWLKLAVGGREALKRQVIDVLKSITTPSWHRYVDRFLERQVRLKAVRAKL